jgi:hypothetical protein
LASKEYIKNRLRVKLKPYADLLYKNKDYLVPLIFTMLMTKAADPAEALGYSGADANSEFFEQNINTKLFQTPQETNTANLSSQARSKYPSYYIDSNGNKQMKPYDEMTDLEKQTAKSMLYVDHVALMQPSEELMDWVYKGTLFGDPDLGLGFFGKYNMKEVREKNKNFNQPK